MTRLRLGVAALAFAGVSMAAGFAAADNATVLLRLSGGHYVPPPEEPKGLVTIYDNFARKYPKGLYNVAGGQVVTGSNSASHPQYWEAQAFTPSADHVVTRIQVSLLLYSGTNKVVIALYDDNAGHPGNVLQSSNAGNIPSACCGLVTAKFKGIPLSAGHQYWVVVKTNKNDTDSYMVWAYNGTDDVDTAVKQDICFDGAVACTGTAGQWSDVGYFLGLGMSVQGSE